METLEWAKRQINLPMSVETNEHWQNIIEALSRTRTGVEQTEGGDEFDTCNDCGTSFKSQKYCPRCISSRKVGENV